MQTYLVIITTALVLTQITRLIQNWAQLKHIKDAYRRNEEAKQLREDLINTMNELIDSVDELKNEIGNRW